MITSPPHAASSTAVRLAAALQDGTWRAPAKDNLTAQLRLEGRERRRRTLAEIMGVAGGALSVIAVLQAFTISPEDEIGPDKTLHHAPRTTEVDRLAAPPPAVVPLPLDGLTLAPRATAAPPAIPALPPDEPRHSKRVPAAPGRSRPKSPALKGTFPENPDASNEDRLSRGRVVARVVFDGPTQCPLDLRLLRGDGAWEKLQVLKCDAPFELPPYLGKELRRLEVVSPGCRGAEVVHPGRSITLSVTCSEPILLYDPADLDIGF